MPSPLTQSSRKRGNGKGNRKSDPGASLSEYDFFWLWKCCICSHQAEMNRWACEDCEHPRCETCVQEFVVVPAGRGIGLGKKRMGSTGLGGRGLDGDDERGVDPVVEIVDEVTLQSNIAEESPNIEADIDEPMLSLSTLIPLYCSSVDDAIFVPRETEDSLLLDAWHSSVLAAISSSPRDFEELTSVHLVRQGPSEIESHPTILVSTKSGDLAIETDLREKISELFPEPIRCSLRVSFEKTSLRRTSGDSLPPICEPRNIAFQELPFCGASIGIKHCVDHTATLGGYLMRDGVAHVLTVDHVVPTDLSDGSSIDITHPSEQESQWEKPWIKVKNQLEMMETCCQICVTLWGKHCNAASFYPCNTLGSILSRSGTRSRYSQEEHGKQQVEMDWALVATEKWPIPLASHMKRISKNLEISTIKPGAHVKATGRTSGLQTGQINTARSLVRHGSRITQEWTVIRDPQSPLDAWVAGGIGVDGDSGAWIIDRDSGSLYGMVWGRDRIKNPICLFSPMVDIVADIKEKTGAKSVALPREDLEMLGGVNDVEILVEAGYHMIPRELGPDRFSGRQNSHPEMISSAGLV